MLEPAEHAAEVARVETEPAPQVTDSGRPGAELEEETRRPQGVTGVEVGVSQDADPLGERSVEPAQHGGLIHNR